MRINLLAVFCLVTISTLFLTVRAAADEISAESVPAVTAETTPAASPETVSATTEVATTEAAGSEEGSNYKGVPWGADFNTFKTLKGFAGSLGPFSAAFVSSADDNDIALLLGVLVSDKESAGNQRVMFELVPRKFASAYFEPDDTYYIFYNGQFALTFSKINENNFDLYRDTFYKKYKKIDSFAKRYEPAAKKTYLLQASIFEKGKTNAFLIKSQVDSGKTSWVSAKLIFASSDLLGIIRKEIEDKIAAENVSSGEREKQELGKDLNKIE